MLPLHFALQACGLATGDDFAKEVAEARWAIPDDDGTVVKPDNGTSGVASVTTHLKFEEALISEEQKVTHSSLPPRTLCPPHDGVVTLNSSCAAFLIGTSVFWVVWVNRGAVLPPRCAGVAALAAISHPGNTGLEGLLAHE